MNRVPAHVRDYTLRWHCTHDTKPDLWSQNGQADGPPDFSIGRKPSRTSAVLRYPGRHERSSRTPFPGPARRRNPCFARDNTAAGGSAAQHPAHYFNLAHRRLRFTPRGAAAYEVTAAPFTGSIDHGAPLGGPSDSRSHSWRIHLPFAFLFGGKNWRDIVINVSGSLTFGMPEAPDYPERETWADGTMRWQASAFDTRAITGERLMIVPFWGLNSAESTRISTRATHDTFTVTWQAVRFQAVNEGYTPLGESTFQVLLRRDGSIEFRYGNVAEKDGIVGVFCGSGPPGQTLDRVDLEPGAHLPAEVELRSVEVEDIGDDLRFRASFAGPIPSKVTAGKLYYGVVAQSQGEASIVRLAVDSSGAHSDPFCTADNPQEQPVGTRCSATMVAIPSARSIEFYLPKIALKNEANLQWKAAVGRGDNPDSIVDTGVPRPLSLKPASASGFDFTHGVRLASGNIYEVFYYPFLPKSRTLTFQEIYQRAPADEDLGLAVTDFRIDDIHNHGETNSAAPEYGDPFERFNSHAIQQAVGPIYLGPRFRETIQDGSRTFHDYAFAVGWAAHEMTHHWSAYLQWKQPNPFGLLEPPDKIHWNNLLATPAVASVSAYFADPPYKEESIMGGMVPEKLSETAMHGVKAPWGAATGLCALDLYAMGLIGPEEVPDTFFISGVTEESDGGSKGGEPAPVTISDIIAANGPRKPSVNDAQRRYKFEIYLLYEDGREPYPAALEQARGIQAAVMHYFTLATSGRMTVVPSR